MSDPRPTTTPITVLTPAEGAELVERQAQEYFGISAGEFARRWYSGEIDPDEHPHAMQVAMLLPLADT
jgi:hypothetical protein